MTMRHAASSSVLVTLLACGGAPPPPTAEPLPAPAPAPVATQQETAPEPEPVVDPEAVAQCETRGKEAKAAEDLDAAVAAYRAGCDGDSGRCCELLAQMKPDELIPQPERIDLHAKACELGDIGGCLNGGQRLQKRDPERASRYLVKGCTMLMERSPRDGTALSFMCGLPLKILHQDREYAAARPIAEVICREDFVLGCTTLGAMLANGDGGARDLDRAREVTGWACAKEEDGEASQACINARKLKAAPGVAGGGHDTLAVERPNLTMNRLGADGITLHDVACRTDGSAVSTLLAGPMLAGAIAKKKALLSRCGNKGDRVRARWEATGGRIAGVKTAGHGPAEVCVQKVLRGTVAPFAGTCVADVEIP